MTRLVLCAKSDWHPAIRREHEIARLAADAGHDVVFVERARDIRTLTLPQFRSWFAGLRTPCLTSEGAITVAGRSTFIPGHRNALASQVDERVLGSLLARVEAEVMVAMVPWDWPAVSRYRSPRRVFDCADDWSQVMPARRARMRALYRRIGAEADAVICASEQLAELFHPCAVTVVRNGTPTALLATRPATRPTGSRMVYAGTMSERFDAPLVQALLGALPDWRLDLYGPCQYAGCASQPDAELARLLARWPTRIAWHGAVERDRLAARLDEGDVLVIPHRRRGAVDGGDAMKFYDYAARGRPVVTTPWMDAIDTIAPPHTHVAATPTTFAAAVRDATGEPPEFASTRRRWAEANAWDTRWGSWAKAALG
jgi:hypothetical protein